MKNYYIEYVDGKREYLQCLSISKFPLPILLDALKVMEVNGEEVRWIKNKVDNPKNKISKEELIDIILKT